MHKNYEIERYKAKWLSTFYLKEILTNCTDNTNTPDDWGGFINVNFTVIIRHSLGNCISSAPESISHVFDSGF